MPIQPLKRLIIDNSDDGLQVTRLPNNEEMMFKINEIIAFVNKLEKEQQEEQHDKIFRSFGARTVL